MFELYSLLKKELTRYQTILWAGAVSYIIWWPMIAYYVPTAVDPLWIRLVLSGILCLATALSYLKKQHNHRYIESLIHWGGFAFLLHTATVTFLSQVDTIHFSGFILLVMGFITILPSKKTSIFAGSLAIASCLAMATQVPQPLTPSIFIPFAMASAVFFAIYINFSRLNTLKELQSAQRQQSALFASLEEGLIVQNAAGDVIAINASAPRILGLSRDEIFGFSAKDPNWRLIHSNGRVLAVDEIPAVMAKKTGRPVRNVIVGIQNKDHSRKWLAINSIPYIDDSGDRRVVSTFSDITEIRDSQEMISRQQAQLFSASKLTSLGEMAAGVAHEINNPLAILAGKISLIKRELNELHSESPVFTHLEKMNHTIFRINKIIKNLQAFSRSGDNDPFEFVELKPLILDLLTFCNERCAKRRIDIQVEVPDDLFLDCRPVQLSQALLGMIHNSTDVLSDYNGERWIKIEAKKEKGRIRIYIQDSGPGISPEIEEKIMQPFFTTKEVGQGTGLGLSTAQGVIADHKGSLVLLRNSNPTTFLIDLPETLRSLKSVA